MMPDEKLVATPGDPPEVFGTDEILWYDNGRWGDCGYALPNPGGKLYCLNGTVWDFVNTVGRATFEIMHREDRRFVKPLPKDCVWDIWQLCAIARQRLSAVAVKPNELEIRPDHATPANQAFLLYPVPYFGDGLRNNDLRTYCRQTLLCLTDAMQHSEADKSAEITAPGFAAKMGQHLWKIMLLIATKYFAYTREQLYDPATGRPNLAFDLKAEDWQKFDYTKTSISFELTEERPDPGWIPTENDLRAIRGIPAKVAMMFGKRYVAATDTFPGGLRFGQPTGEQPTGSVPSLPNTGAFPQPPGPP